MTGTKCAGGLPQACYPTKARQWGAHFSHLTARVSDSLPNSRREFVETTGRLCQLMGLPRSTGQIYGLLYLAPRPLSLDDIAELLSISKASASTGTRQLVTWQAVKEVWVPGDRRDHFEALGDLRELLRAGYRNFLQPKFGKSQRKLDQLMAALDQDRQDGVITGEDHAFCRKRLESLGKLQARIDKILPLVESFL